MTRLYLFVWLFFQTATAWAIKPMPVWIATPDTFGMKYKQLTLTTSDHLHLASWLVDPSPSVTDQHTTLVLAASDYGNMSYQLYQARAMSSVGYRVLLFDYRGFGHSDGFTIDPQRLYYDEFATDLRSALAEAREQRPTDRVGILSYSMGTILATKVASTNKCDFLITDSYIAHPQALVSYYQTKQKLVTLPTSASSYEMIARKVNCPWLLIAGTEDQRTPIADALAIAHSARRQQKRLVLSVKCDHLRAIEVLSSEKDYGDKYAQAISRFLTGKFTDIKE